MGNTSSQVAPSQVPTQDVPVTSQPSTQLPALDGTQEESQPQTLKRVASSMDASVEDTIRKAKKARSKDAARAHRKSIPQHTLGYAIQPSQEVPDTQEEVQADAGASEGEEQAAAGEDDAVDEALVMPPKKSESKAAAKANKAQSKKRRLPRLEDEAEQPVDDGNRAPEPLEEVDVITLAKSQSLPTKQKKRKRKDLELERLQKDVEDFAPELESTPKPKPVVKRQKRAKDVDKPETIDEQPEPEDEIEDAPAQAKPQNRSKPTKSQAKAAPTTNASRLGATTSKSKSKKPPKAAAPSEDIDPASTTVPKAATRPRQKHQPIAELDGAVDDVDDEEAVPGAEPTAPAEDANEDPPVDSIPTPPESPDDAAPAGMQADDDDEQGEVADEDSHHKGSGQEDDYEPVSAAKPRSKKPKKTSAEKKRQKQAAIDGEKQNNAAIGEKKQKKAPSDEKKRKRALGDDDDSPKKERGEVQGTWSKDERARADEIFEDVVRVTAVPDWELKANIIDWKNPTPHLQQFKDALYEAFPKRSFKSILRFCQRRYCSYERGKWTAEQDQLLREAYELTPDQWTDISDFVGRFWEDCRGRWRDVLSRPESKAETGPWTREEEMRLAKIVQECRELILKETEDEEVRENPEQADALVSWKVVSEKMNDARSAKRCRERWARIKHQDLSAKAVPTVSQPIKSNPEKMSSRDREAETDYLQCKPGDVHDILTEICFAVPDVTRLFEHETTFWSIVAMKNPGSKFTSALRRKALSTAVEDYPCKAVYEAETLAGKARGAKDRMEVLERKGRIELSRAYRGRVKKQAVKKTKKKDGEKADVDKDDDDDDDDVRVERKKTKSKKPKKPAEKANKAVDDDDAGEVTAKETKEKPSKPKPTKKRTSAPKPKTIESNKYKSADLVIETDDEGETGDDVEVDQTLAAKAPVDDPDDGDDDDDEQEVEADGGRARQQTEELQSLGDELPDMSPSTFIDVLKGGKRVRKGIKGVKNREGVKAFGLRRNSGERRR